MSKRFLLFLLIAWNVLLTGAVIWSLSRSRVPDRLLKEKLSGIELDTVAPQLAPVTWAEGDTLPPPDAKIAYFMMDTLQARSALVKESAERVRSEGQRMENNLQREMQKAQARYNELVAKDHTYSTQAEVKADQAEVEQLGEKIQRLQADSQDKLDEMQARFLNEIASDLKQFLEEYNKQAGYDYIFSIQDAGQIWVGNKALDITPAVVKGLNARHAQRKQGQAK